MSGPTLSAEEKNIWRIVDAIRQIIRGRSNAVGTVTLRANQVTTVVTARNCGVDSQPQLSPRTLNAAAALATTYIKAADILNGQFTITHASTVTTDRTFGWETFG